MKKNIISWLLCCCMVLLVACGEDDKTNETGDVSQVRISATLPGEFAQTRGGGDATHKLRCILEVWNQDAEPKLLYHGEVVAGAADKTTALPFDFEMAAGAYDCLMWADYIDVNADSEERTPENGSDNATFVYHIDKYYNTTDLRSISVKDVSCLVNNDASDAFFYSGEIVKQEGAALQLEVALVRPISKISLKEKDLKKFKQLQGLTVSLDVPTVFNVATGQVSEEMATVNYTDTNFDPSVSPDGTLFSACVFAKAADHNLGEIELNFVTLKLPLQKVIVPAVIPVMRGKYVRVGGNMMEVSSNPSTDFEITYDIDITDWAEFNQEIVVTETPPVVGDFFYKDGSYSSSYVKSETNPCIGVVFAVTGDGGKAANDEPKNYITNGGVQKLEKVHGWVIAAYDLYRPGSGFKLVPLAAANVEIPEEVKMTKEDLKGFRNTEAFKAKTIEYYPIVKLIVDYENNPQTKAPANTSGWYWGAAKQYAVLSEEYAKTKDEDNNLLSEPILLAVEKSLEILEKEGVGKLIPVNGNQRRHWYSTCGLNRKGVYQFGFACLGIAHKDYGGLEDDWASTTEGDYNARPILTF